MTDNNGIKKHGSVLIVGGGIGGMQAALDLAESGFKVHIVQKDSCIGGTMAMLDKTFPTGDCAMCMISPKMVEVGRHLNIVLHTLSEVTSIKGDAGDFSVKIKQQARYVDAEKCTGCGLCDKKCPKLVSSEFEQGLANRKAIYSVLPQAVPNTRVIDSQNCLFFQRGRCKACEKLCPSKAINFNDSEKKFELKVGSIILSPGLSRYNPILKQELGFGRFKNVVSSVQFERILSASGPFMGKIIRPTDERHPKKIAWIQCVGSRDFHKANPWCSSVCCMYATKQAVIAKEHDKNINPTIFYMEMRAFGKDFDKYVDRAKNEYGVLYKRAMISSVHEEAGTNNLILRYSNEEGKLLDESFDMVVLSIGFEPHKDALDFAETFKIEPNEYRFAKTSGLAPVQTSQNGIFVTGIYQGPKDIPETVMQGSAVAGSVMAILSEVRGTEISEKIVPQEKDVTDEDARIGVFVCHCGINISQTVDVHKVVNEIKDLPNVIHAENMMYACAQDGQDKIKSLIEEKKLNRVVVASCTPRTHQPLFQETIREAGLNKYLFELADIREQCSWCHMGQNEVATKKASDIVKMNISKARLLSPIKTESVNVTPSALVIGGGISGIISSLNLSDQGFIVHIVEKEKSLGGLVNKLFRTLDKSDIQNFVKQKIAEIEQSPRITVHLGTEVDKTEGFVGNFKTILTDKTTFEHGAIIIASGGTEYIPTEFNFGQNDRIITQRELEKRLEQSHPSSGNELYAMIQCVGSREEPNNYCSRICCQDAIKNAIAIREKFPKSKVVIFYRDIRTYGLREDYYRKARELGVIFIRYEKDKKPEIKLSGNKIGIVSHDYILNRPVEFKADYLVLSTGLRPHPYAPKLSKMYKITLNPDGFFLEAHVKLRPVDFPSEGIFVAGLAHAPKNLDETISQALAAAGRAGVLLSHTKLGVSGIISKHNRDICMSCLSCIRHCPFGAPYIDEDGKISHNEVKCTGCGICAGICPAKAFQVNSFRDDQILSMIDTLAENIC
ncbi:MAG: CoB--CoM heterodisulfide reductase iron-sulfur subunit A family protein [Desulfobacterales bacterium]|nr:CoB--CoM heterodisulfide reductase iron-sulfur subunit A family protein [Desulfobacterales bacterium]